MAKAILELEMPESCRECLFYKIAVLLKESEVEEDG